MPGATHDSLNHTAAARRLVVLSATYRDTPTDAREAVAASLPPGDRFVERVSLHTCHRVELIGILANARDEPQHLGLQLTRGSEAAERVFLVAGGLDSAVVGEEQLLGQARAAYEDARAAGQTGPVLDQLMQRAIRFGKGVRSELQPNADVGLAERAVRWALAQPREPGRQSALVIGTGEIGRLVAQRLASRGLRITVASRSAERAALVVGDLPGSVHSTVDLEPGLRRAGEHGLVAIAVRSATVPLDAQHLAGPRLPAVIDLSAPRAVTRAAAELLGDRLLDLDRLGSLATTRQLRPAAERRLRAGARREAANFMRWWSQRSSADGIATLHAHVAAIRERHLERLRRRSDLTPAQLTAVETATAAMFGELLHQPTIRLRGEPDARAAVARVFGLDS